MTNGDKIRQMSNEELAKEFAYECENKCVVCTQGGTTKCNFNCAEGIKLYLDMEVEK